MINRDGNQQYECLGGVVACSHRTRSVEAGILNGFEKRTCYKIYQFTPHKRPPELIEVLEVFYKSEDLTKFIYATF